MQSRIGNSSRFQSEREFRSYLLGKIETLLAGLSVEDFRRDYYDFYLEEVPDDALSERDLEFFGAVQEKLDWVDPAPDSESRQSGWLDHDQFLSWVRALYEAYKSGKRIEADVY